MAESESTRQLVVIGAGPGGYTAAFLAADLGMQVTLVDKEKNPGGACLYRGCIPTKALLHVAKVITDAGEARNWGVDFAEPGIDVDRIRAWKDGVVGKLTQGLGQLTKRRKIEYIEGAASFIDSNTVNVNRADGGTMTISFRHVILATGARAASLPGLPSGSPLVMDSTSALDLKDIPKTMLVIGGGYIGLELGSVYAALGTKVSVVEITPGLMPGTDAELVRFLARRLEKTFAAIMLNTKVAQVSEDDGGLRVMLEGTDAREEVYNKVLVSVGRKPNSAGIGLENTKVQIDERGFVKVNNKLQTADPSIYAIGDVAGMPLLAHKASHEGRIAAEVLAGHDVVFDPGAIPFVEYTHPEIAECGLNEERAKAEGRDVKVAKFPWAASGRAATLGESEGLTKLVIDPGTEKVLGMGIVGAGAGELIAEGALAVEMSAKASDLASTIHPHPTLSETVMEAAEVFYGTSTHVYRPRRD